MGGRNQNNVMGFVKLGFINCGRDCAKYVLSSRETTCKSSVIGCCVVFNEHLNESVFLVSLSLCCATEFTENQV